MKFEIENARELVESSGKRKRLNVGAYTKTMQQLDTKLGAAVASGLAAGSPVALAAKQLISNLNVI